MSHILCYNHTSHIWLQNRISNENIFFIMHHVREIKHVSMVGLCLPFLTMYIHAKNNTEKIIYELILISNWDPVRNQIVINWKIHVNCIFHSFSIDFLNIKWSEENLQCHQHSQFYSEITFTVPDIFTHTHLHIYISNKFLSHIHRNQLNMFSIDT